MSYYEAKDYIKLIIFYLNDISKIPKDKMNKETSELNIDIFSENLFKQLYHNLFYFYKINGKKSIKNKMQIDFFSEVAKILDIIYEVKPQYFFEYYFIKALLIYIIYSLNYDININPEIVLKIFFGFENILQYISNKSIFAELQNFENEITEMIKQLIIIYAMDSDIYLDINCENNFDDIIQKLNRKKDKIPLYFQGIIDYSSQLPHKKFLIMKIYKYFQKINPYNDNRRTALYQGYSLYGINSYKKIQQIDCDEFRNIQKKKNQQ